MHTPIRSLRPPLLTLALIVSLAAGACGKKEESKAARPAQPAAKASAAPSNEPPRGVPARLDASAPAAKDTAERAAQALRRLALTTTDPAAIAPLMDPSQASIAGKFVPALLIHMARVEEMLRAAREKFGDEGAKAVNPAATVYSIDLGNGLREMFSAERFEEVRRDGAQAYVMSNNAKGEPQGAPLVFRDNQGDWLLLLCDGDKPWDDKKLGQYSILSGPVASAGKLNAAIEALTARIRQGEFKTAADLAATVNSMIQPGGV